MTDILYYRPPAGNWGGCQIWDFTQREKRFIGSSCKGEVMEQCSFHLIPHFEECLQGITVSHEFIFGNFMEMVASFNLPQEAEPLNYAEAIWTR